jgi:hypothetical protein
MQIAERSVVFFRRQIELHALKKPRRTQGWNRHFKRKYLATKILRLLLNGILGGASNSEFKHAGIAFREK